MKRKLGIALLVIATMLAGAPEAVRQFHDLNKAVRHWAGTNLGGSFLVYAEDNNGERALPDRYDYHQVAPPVRPASYGLTASLSLPATHDATPCPLARRRTIERTQQAPRTPATTHASEQVARSQRRIEREVQHAQTAREIRRVLRLTVKSLGDEVNSPAFVESLNTPELATKIKALRIKPSVEPLKPRRSVPVRIACLNEGDGPFTFTLAPDPDVRGFDADKNHR
ncbi:MAG TPA: hypothetical protein VE821_01120 [Pyrinomonadaceae bacterium]|nr:hypothetical protein [Pyrinomonadaceae bacterium]